MNKAKIEKMAREARAKAAQAKARSATVQPKPTTVQSKSGTATPKPGTVNAITSDAREAAQERETRGAVNLTPETIDAIVGGFSRELRRALLELGPILARLAAADTIHSVERVATVLGRAVVEGRTAADVVKEMEVKG